MRPEVKTGLRRLAVVITGTTSVTIAYALHLFSGWPRTVLMIVGAVSLVCAIRLLIAEGRERERTGR